MATTAKAKTAPKKAAPTKVAEAPIPDLPSNPFVFEIFNVVTKQRSSAKNTSY